MEKVSFAGGYADTSYYAFSVCVYRLLVRCGELAQIRMRWFVRYKERLMFVYDVWKFLDVVALAGGSSLSETHKERDVQG